MIRIHPCRKSRFGSNPAEKADPVPGSIICGSGALKKDPGFKSLFLTIITKIIPFFSCSMLIVLILFIFTWTVKCGSYEIRILLHPSLTTSETWAHLSAHCPVAKSSGVGQHFWSVIFRKIRRKNYKRCGSGSAFIWIRGTGSSGIKLREKQNITLT